MKQLLLVIFLTCPFFTHPQQVDDTMVTVTTSESEEAVIEHRVALNVLKSYTNEAEWNPEQDQLPINTVEAIKRSRDYLRRVKGVTNDLVFQNYCVKNAIVPVSVDAGRISYPRIWYAQIQFLPKDLRKTKIAWNKLSVVVLFNYTIADSVVTE